MVSQRLMEPECSLPNSEELSTCSYPEPDQSSPHHLFPPLQLKVKKSKAIPVTGLGGL
jgi:hypothetical protein